MSEESVDEAFKRVYEAFKRAWEDYPSQDNEGYVPDRGAFKAGFFAGVHWLEKTKWIRSVTKLMAKAPSALSEKKKKKKK